MLPELEPGITPVTRPVLSMLAGFDCHAPPLTDQKRRTPAIPSSSWAVAVTVMLWLAGGTAGLWFSDLKVGPRLEIRRELGIPGVPERVGRVSVVVLATRLK